MGFQEHEISHKPPLTEIDPELNLPRYYTRFPKAIRQHMAGHERAVRLAIDTAGVVLLTAKKNTIGLSTQEELYRRYFRKQLPQDRLNHPEWPTSRIG